VADTLTGSGFAVQAGVADLPTALATSRDQRERLLSRPQSGPE
jgi:hypothetical protein